MKSAFAFALLSFAALSTAVHAQGAPEAKPLIHPMFSDNMVIQRDRPAPVWGWAAPGAKVNVTFRDRGYVVDAGADGKWTLTLPTARAGGPYWLRVTTSGGREVMLKNVMMGDVWVCSGQSNMEMGIEAVNDAEKEIAAASHPDLRLYVVPHRIAYQPEWNPRGQWLVSTPENIRKGVWAGFSAVAYFFGRDLLERYDVPIGLIQTAWGGTPAEAWTSSETLSEKLPEFRPAIAAVSAAARAAAAGTYNYAAELERWLTAKDPGSNAPNGWERVETNDADWKTMALPQHWDRVGFADFDGIIWFRTEFNLPASAAGKDAVLHLGPIDDGDTTWVNGVKVGQTDNHQAVRAYKVPGSALKPGRNVLAVRVYDIASNGGFYGKPDDMRLEVGGQTVPLAGDWKYRVGPDLATMGPRPVDPNAGMPNMPSVLYNGMIAPIPPFAIKGVIWYQGESNSNRAQQYQTLLPAMIEDWRETWNQGDFPFLIVQIANYMARKPEPSESQWAELREAQAITAQTVPNTALAVTIDIGEANDIHPRNKQDVGRRLAVAARNIAYGESGVVLSGPTYREHEVVGREMRVFFDNVDGGLAAKDGSRGGRIPGFAIAGADGKFVWADARIAGAEINTADGKVAMFGPEAATTPGARVDGIAVVVSNPNVRDPQYVRYAWADNPEAGLYNKAGLPAVPFRTDSGMGRAVQPARLVSVPKPTAPAFDDWHNVSVTVRFNIGADGRVTGARVVRSSDIRFNRAALDATKGIKAEPATVNGKPVETQTTHTYRFQAW